ncbi:MAG: hypothetical protein IPI67_27920 [Myxococcales bacterium]|nr:hypothetical protein [Myxococcales bacterium]
MTRSAFWLLLCSVFACGGAQHVPDGRPTAADPRMPPSGTVVRVRERLGDSPQACGEAVEGIDSEGCRAQPVLECIHAAFEANRPAQGTHMYATAEGDPVRVDYFVIVSSGHPTLVVVTDRTADPVGDKAVEEQECLDARWSEHSTPPACQALVPGRCTLRSRTPRGKKP